MPDIAFEYFTESDNYMMWLKMLDKEISNLVKRNLLREKRNFAPAEVLVQEGTKTGTGTKIDTRKGCYRVIFSNLPSKKLSGDFMML